MEQYTATVTYPATTLFVTREAAVKLMELWDASHNFKNAGNGRAVRNVFERAERMQHSRIFENSLTDKKSLMTITAEDVPNAEEVFR